MSHPWWALVALSMLACGAPASPGPAIVFSPCTPVRLAPFADTTAAERDSLEAAVARWRQVGVTSLTLGETTDPDALPIHFKDAAALFHGVYEPESGTVYINRGLAGTEREVTVAHELGHALGLPHVDRVTRSSVMNPSNLTVFPSPDDEGELQRLWHCPL